MKTKSGQAKRADVTDEQLAKRLTEAQRELLLYAARSGRGWCSLDVSGDGSGAHASAKALGRKGLLACAHPGGPGWGEWNITDRGRRVAAIVRGIKPTDLIAEKKPNGEASSRRVSTPGRGVKTQPNPSITTAVITGAWLTAVIRSGTDVSDITTLTPEQYDAVKRGNAEIVGDTSTVLTVRPVTQ